MAIWKKECKEFVKVREMISDGDDYKGILSEVAKICSKYATQKWDFAYDYEQLGDEINFVIDADECDEDNVDFYLDEFYDLCDGAGVWLSF